MLLSIGSIAMSLRDSARAATLQDFGYQNRTLNGKLPLGARPLLVIMADFEGKPAFPHGRQHYFDLVFGFATPPAKSLNGYFREVSKQRFTWLPVLTSQGPPHGIIHLTLPSGDCLGDCPATPGGPCFIDRYCGIDGCTAIGCQEGDRRYYANIVSRALASGLVDFASYDANLNGVVTPDELTIAIINNDFRSGAARTSGRVSGATIDYDSLGAHVTNLGFALVFDTWCHELSHAIRALDLYVNNNLCRSNQVTLMSCTGGADDLTYHLDPWHKTQLGWSEPRIRSLRDGGTATISAAQGADPTAPIVLYDPTRGTGEFFILEYRTPLSPDGAGYDADVASAGLAIWQVKQNANHDPVVVNGETAVWNRGAPDLQLGGSTLFASGETTPVVNFLDGTSTERKIHVRPFTSGTGQITVDWTFVGDVWVDFGFSGSQQGTFSSPFNALAAGLNAVAVGSTLFIKPGSSSETATITRPMILRSFGGAATIGR